MHALRGVGVLVTRPEQQATPLCRLLESAGAVTWRLPAIEIRPTGFASAAGHEARAIEAYDIIIFTSANAVRFGSALLEGRGGSTLAAIGPATARALAAAGHRAAVSPPAGFDSETLLSHPVLANPAGRRILLVKGMNGRDVLRAELTRRGALVAVADVYQRASAAPDAAALAALEAEFAAGRIHVVTATSMEIAEGLLHIATPALRRGFDHVHWLTPGPRVSHGLRERGMSAPVIEAASAADQDLVAAVVRWRSSVSGA